MNVKRWREGSAFFVAVAIMTGTLFCARLVSYVAAKKHLREMRQGLDQLKKRQPNSAESSVRPPDAAIQGVLGDEAKGAGVRRLLSIGTADDRGKDLVSVEWEADGPSTVQLLRRLEGRMGRCEKLAVTNGEAAGGAPLLRVSASFERRLGAAPTEREKINTSTATLARNVFAPLWDVKKENPLELQARVSKKHEEAMKIEQDRLEKERQAHDEQQKLATKKQQLESQLTLTGIVNNGHEALAFVSNKESANQTLMVRSGDVISEARVAAIDESKGEVQLDYLGKLQVRLKISSTGGYSR